MKTFALAAAAAIAVIAAPAGAANLVTNGGFEDGITGWDTNFLTMNATSFAAHTGNMSAGTGCTESFCNAYGTGAYVRQSLATQLGTLYTLSFYVGENAIGPSGLAVYWNGNLLPVATYTLNNPANASLPTFDTATRKYTGTWRLVTVSNLLANPLGNSELEIHGFQRNGTIFFDDISVDSAAAAASPVPEPATWAMMIAGFGMIGATLRTRRRSVAFAI